MAAGRLWRLWIGAGPDRVGPLASRRQRHGARSRPGETPRAQERRAAGPGADARPFRRLPRPGPRALERPVWYVHVLHPRGTRADGPATAPTSPTPNPDSRSRPHDRPPRPLRPHHRLDQGRRPLDRRGVCRGGGECRPARPQPRCQCRGSAGQLPEAAACRPSSSPAI